MRRSPRDHPRMRGEHKVRAAALDVARGSSPHARGAHGGRGHRRPGQRIIPACAGSTRCSASSCPACWDHPRMRGEHAAVARVDTLNQGSSPHARGAQAQAEDAPGHAGIIPACAGSTRDLPRQFSVAEDHPRMRGEHSVVASIAVTQVGSSPHARGAPPRQTSTIPRCGIIPACAGSAP